MIQIATHGIMFISCKKLFSMQEVKNFWKQNCKFLPRTTEKRPQWNTINIHAINLQKLNLDIQLLKNSTTRLLIANSRVQQRVKDAATILWRQHSPSYDNNRRGRPGLTISRTPSAKDKDHWRFKTHSHESTCVSPP
jgi:hypothetical protein